MLKKICWKLLVLKKELLAIRSSKKSFCEVTFSKNGKITCNDGIISFQVDSSSHDKDVIVQ